jgi:hypothetical protein
VAECHVRASDVSGRRPAGEHERAERGATVSGYDGCPCRRLPARRQSGSAAAAPSGARQPLLRRASAAARRQTLQKLEDVWQIHGFA